MAARASSTEPARDRASAPTRWLAATFGTAWGHASLAAAGWIAQVAAPVMDTPAGSTSLRLLEWSVLLPLSLGAAATHATTRPLATLLGEGLPVPALVLPAVAGCAIALAGSYALRSSGGRRVVRTCLLTAVLISILSGASLSRALADDRAAERLFLRMVAADSAPWEEPTSRSAARTLVGRHPDSRWASEGWRVVATDAELRGEPAEAVEHWKAFGACFGEEAVPGRALAEFNVARLLEERAPADVAAAHYRQAFRTVGETGATSQLWIGVESSRALETLSRDQGLYAIANRWATHARMYESDRHEEDQGAEQ